MGKQTFHGVKKTITLLLLVSLVVSLTAASVSAAWSSGGGSGPTGYAEKEQTSSEKGTCAKSVEKQAPSEKGACAKQSSAMLTKKRYKSFACDCCCEAHGSNTNWYCPGRCFTSPEGVNTCSQDCKKD